MARTGRSKPAVEPRIRDRTDWLIIRLRSAILERSLPAADGSLPAQGDLARRYGVSRTVVREAMVHLAAQGLIVVEQGRRARVRPPDPRQWAESLGAVIAAGGWTGADLMAARRLVEGETAALAAARREAGTVAALEREIVAYRAADHRAAALAADRAFHAAIAAGTGNPVLDLLYRSLDEAIAGQQRQTHRGRTLDWVPRDHQRILAAIRVGDAAAARRAMHRHLDRVAATLDHRGEAQGRHP